MKFIQTIFTVLAAFLLLAGCKKEQIEPLPISFTAGKANLKIIHASAYPTNVAVHLKVNDTRISNNITYSTPFPGGGLNTGGSNMPWYLPVNSGSTKITLAYPKFGTSNDSITLYSNTVNLEADKFYSAYITDTGSLTQTVLVTENVTPANDGESRFKFVNLMPNQAALDLYFGANKVASNIAYKAVSPDFTIARGTVAQWAIRPAGAAPTTTAIAVYPAAAATQVIPNKRLFTVFSRGYSGGTGNRLPAISLLYN